MDASDDSEEDDMFELRKRSKLEEHYLEEAKKRHKQSIVKKQIVWGKEFKGDAFIPDPKAIIFEDFEVGEVYTTKITLTNVSFTFNTFKILELRNEIKDFFEISYKLPGKMSAGTTSCITIKFTPRINQDIEDVLPCLAQTGPFSIPLVCRTKKVVVSVTPKEIDFSGVVLCEEKTIEIRIRNDGALDTAFRLSGDAIQHHLMKRTENKPAIQRNEDNTPSLQNSRVLKVSALAGFVHKHEETRFSVTFVPMCAGSLHSSLVLKFEDEFTPDITMRIIGEGKNVPIYLERSIIDFKHTYFGTVYRDSLIIHNRGTISMKCKLNVPKELQGCLEFFPSIGFVQTETPFNILVKFKPLHKMIKQFQLNTKGCYNKDTRELDIPIRVDVPYQVMPVFFKLKAILTDSNLRMEPNVIDFGKCNTDEIIQKALSIKNTSLLPQTFNFLNLAPEIKVLPSNNVEVQSSGKTTFEIGAGGRMEFFILFCPKEESEYSFEILCKNMRSEKFAVSCTAAGVRPPLRFDIPLLQLSAVGRGDFIIHEVIMENITKKPQEYHFDIPELCGISVKPDSGSLLPGEKISIAVRFSAPKGETVIKERIVTVPQDTNEVPIESPKSGRKGKQNSVSSRGNKNASKNKLQEPSEPITKVEQEMIDFYKDWEKSPDNEPWNRKKKFVLPCFIKEYELGCIFLQVNATVVSSDLVIELEGREVNEYSFGDSPIFHMIDVEFVVKNIGGVKTRLSIGEGESKLESGNPFIITKQPKRTLESGESSTLKIRFAPEIPNYYEHNIQIHSTNTNKAQLWMRGNAQNPRIEMQPQENDINFGQVSIRSEEKHTIQLTNKCPIQVPFTIEFLSSTIHPFNHDGSCPFMASPSRGTIPVNGSVDVSMQFYPDHRFEFYRAICFINYGGKIHRKYILLQGNACLNELQKNEKQKHQKDYTMRKVGSLSELRAICSVLPLEDPFKIFSPTNATESQKTTSKAEGIKNTKTPSSQKSNKTKAVK